MHDVLAALTMQQGCCLGVEIPPVQLEASQFNFFFGFLVACISSFWHGSVSRGACSRGVLPIHSTKQRDYQLSWENVVMNITTRGCHH